MNLQTPYQAYAYSYPHKTAYRPLEPPVSLQDVWAEEKKDALFLYLHVPFCEMRCGFCNLFTTANPRKNFADAYLQALRRQAERVQDTMGPAAFVRMAVGGGTPTFLDCAGLETLFDIASDLFGVQMRAIPVSVETSPQTATADRLRLLRERGVDRISIGIQSFVEAEVRAAGRGQRTEEVEAALERIRAAGFPTLNTDLIYGLPGQTVESWLVSLRAALHFAPEELYLYPLYVRPLTGLDHRFTAHDSLRLDCYRAGRDLLCESGYAQVSMRMFRKEGRRPEEREGRRPKAEGERETDEGGRPVYCCQEDGMVGIGCGARSYTNRLHYAAEYAVGRVGVKEILADYVTRADADFEVADYGYRLDEEDRCRRYVIKSLLQVEGLEFEAYRTRFHSDAREELPMLCELVTQGWASLSADRLTLTEAGLEYSDAIGPWLYSERARGLMEAFALR